MFTEQNTTTQKRKEARKRREAIYWAVVLIWAGLVFAAENLGLLPQLGRSDAWNWVFFGAGLFALTWSIRRSTAPDRPEPIESMWNLVWAGSLLILGLGGLTPVSISIPLILLLVGVALLGTSLSRNDRSLS